MSDIEVLQRLTGEDDTEVLALLLEQAEKRILAYTNRSYLTAMLEQVKIDWAVIAYNRMGTEGEASRSEGGITASFVEIPDSIRKAMNNNRLVKVAEYAFEKQSN